MQRLQVSYEGSPSSVPEARHAVEQALHDWGMDELGWTAALLVSELAANVTLHARTGFTVVLEILPGGGARLEVRDGSARIPRQRRFGEQATTGRGLHLVEDLAAAWGVDLVEGGKTVWAELAASPERAQTDGAPDDEPDLDALLLAFPDLDDDAPRALAA
ncbi:MAG: protein phosphatase [Frankiales bacterium]|nr:protein phosphatase [Frankiales bacterium]